MKLDVHEGQRLLHMLDMRSSVIGMPLTQTQIATGVMRAKCWVPDEYILESTRPLLMGREVLMKLMAQWTDRTDPC